MIKDRPTLVQKALVALFVGFLTFGKQIGFWLIDESRYYHLWQPSDNLALILDVFLIAGVAWGISVALRALNLDFLRRLYNHLFLLAVASGVLTLGPARFVPRDDMPTRLKLMWLAVWLVVLAVTAISFFRPALQIVRRVANLCLLFSPLSVILLGQIAMMSSWSSPAETDPALAPAIPQVKSATATNQPPVFIFVFDEWSYARSFNDGEPLPGLINLRRFSSQACNFTNAWSFSARTLSSMPALIFQLDQRLDVGKDNSYFKRDGKKVASSEFASVLGRARQRGYATAMQGYYLPYAKMLGSQADYCRSFSAFPRHERLWGHMLDKFIRNLEWLTDPFLDEARRILDARITSRRWYDVNVWLRDEVFRLLDQCPRQTLAVLHWPMPHGPFVLNEDGSYRGPYPRGNILTGLRGSAGDYHRHLLFQDKLVGQIVEHLQAAGKYDDAFIVLTADHGWRDDPLIVRKDLLHDIQHRKVPLLIKFPGQKTGQRVEKIVYNHLVLRPLIESVWAGNFSEARATAAIQNLEELPLPSGVISKRPKR